MLLRHQRGYDRWALLDLGAREEALREALEALPLNGYEITIGRTKKMRDRCL